MMRVRRWLALPLACLLAACIFVDDFGTYWDSGTLDPQLKGAWKADNGDACEQFVVDGKNYRFVHDADEEDTVRTLSTGKHTFLMVRNEKENNYIFRYTVTKDTWTLYVPNEEKRDEFAATYATKNFALDDDVVRIGKLDRQTVIVLEKLAGMPEFWKISDTYTRTDACAAG